MHKQQGLTPIGMLFTIAAFIFFGMVAMRVTVVYLNHYAVVSSVSGLKQLPPTMFTHDPAVNIKVLQKSLMNRLEVNGIDYITAKQINIVAKNHQHYLISVTYKAKAPLFANTSLVFDFDVKDEVKLGQL